MSLAKRLVDAIAEDLDTHADLPNHSTAKYRRPSKISAGDCPLLVVWLQSKQPTPVETSSFDGQLSIGISWHIETVAKVFTLINEADVATALMDAIETIEDRIRTWAKEGLGIDAAWNVQPGETLYLPPEMAQGLTEGFATEALVTVTE